MIKDDIGNRMKHNYENRSRFYLTRRTPVIMRLDGRAFHTFTRNAQKPYDELFSKCMNFTALFLCSEIQGAKCAYIQSDEISILITDFDKLTTEAWFDYNIQKMTSISAGLASVYFFKEIGSPIDFRKEISLPVFDSRVFNLPKEEVCNYFIWRQIDWVRNSLQMLAQSNFSHKELQNKNSQDLHEMLYAKNINWANLEPKWKNGTFYYKADNGWFDLDYSVIFKNDRNRIERYLVGE